MNDSINPRWQAFCNLRLKDGKAIDKFEYMIWVWQMKHLYLTSIGDSVTSSIHGTISDHDAFTKFIEEYVK
jgi:hypothetical protein